MLEASCDGGCNPTCQRLQPRVTCWRLQPRVTCWRLQPRVRCWRPPTLQPPYSYVPQVRGLPDLKMLGLPRNVLVWDGEQLGTWLDALG